MPHGYVQYSASARAENGTNTIPAAAAQTVRRSARRVARARPKPTAPSPYDGDCVGSDKCSHGPRVLNCGASRIRFGERFGTDVVHCRKIIPVGEIKCDAND